VSLRITGYETIGSKGYVGELMKLGERLGVEERINHERALPRGELLRRCDTADVGVALIAQRPTDLNLDALVGASNKPFDYLARGLALLVPGGRDWRSTYIDPSYGLSCEPEDTNSIAEALRWFVEHRHEARMMGERGRQRILNEWNYERQFSPVLAWLCS
jgi:glycosyltransferase involved in cell wall biosynthesis